MKEEKIIYEPHPVTRERKADLRAKGYTIIDAVYTPRGSAPSMFSPDGIQKMERADVIECLEVHGISASDCKGVPLRDLRALLTKIMFI